MTCLGGSDRGEGGLKGKTLAPQRVFWAPFTSISFVRRKAGIAYKGEKDTAERCGDLNAIHMARQIRSRWT